MANRRIGAFFDEEGEADDDEILHNEMRRERMRNMFNGNPDEEDPNNMQNMLDFEDVKGPLSAWLKKLDVITFVQNQFNSFLRHFRDDNGNYYYEDRLHEMCMNNK